MGGVDIGLFNVHRKKSLLSNGIELGNMGKYHEAIKLYNKALDLDSEYVDAWHSKGVALANLENYSEALKCFERF